MASSSGNDDDLTIPRAAINKMIKETLPNVRVANDARELVVNCCTEFIHLISSEANEICNKSEKKTISPEHVIQALESLGFGSYISEVKEVLQECKTVALKRRKASSRLENLGIPEEELLRQQQELFAKARQQQAELAQQEWLQMQQAAQQAQPLHGNGQQARTKGEGLERRAAALGSGTGNSLERGGACRRLGWGRGEGESCSESQAAEPTQLPPAPRAVLHAPAPP